VTIDSRDGSITRNEEYYAFAHASRFVRPGARRIASSSGVDSVESVAFRNVDGSTALIMLNAGSTQRPVTVRFAGRTVGHTLQRGAVATFRWN
jgi:glucosylceramidase